jgi:hypothetical protein
VRATTRTDPAEFEPFLRRREKFTALAQRRDAAESAGDDAALAENSEAIRILTREAAAELVGWSLFDDVHPGLRPPVRIEGGVYLARP